ncbi:hypothetical protein BO71DRAFT_190522 [Aspergillus ellipticus CBS 707.79]|uniref:Uncharacterized protein n=1 Tax=Aspergillus ellipticus CBS 707.79 TaxID=1448320 RepID=A0A319D8K5_9EURO|nr:hypothetical protein BO71DRAFT_190522 [Aspergillus ellipticus CBS 707.79]
MADFQGLSDRPSVATPVRLASRESEVIPYPYEQTTFSLVVNPPPLQCVSVGRSWIEIGSRRRDVWYSSNHGLSIFVFFVTPTIFNSLLRTQYAPRRVSQASPGEGTWRHRAAAVDF